MLRDCVNQSKSAAEIRIDYYKDKLKTRSNVNKAISVQNEIPDISVQNPVSQENSNSGLNFSKAVKSNMKQSKNSI